MSLIRKASQLGRAIVVGAMVLGVCGAIYLFAAFGAAIIMAIVVVFIAYVVIRDHDESKG